MIKIDFSATYGTFNLDMKPVNVIDVKNVIANRFLNRDRITIPAGCNFNACFTDPAYEERKFLQIKIADRTFNIIEDDYQRKIVIDMSNLAKKIKLIYYVYVNPGSNWRGIISGQLLQLKSFGILDEADLYVHITDAGKSLNSVVALINELCEDVKISTSTENNFEYPGIKLTYDLAVENPEYVFGYLHSKGMSYNVHSRRIDEKVLLGGTFEDWRRKLEFFNDNSIQKIGLFPAIGDNNDSEHPGTRGGWIWFNFWFARGKYLINCGEPNISEDRYFFEHWLGFQNGKLAINDDCYSLYRENKKTYFTPAAAVDSLKELIIAELSAF